MIVIIDTLTFYTKVITLELRLYLHLNVIDICTCDWTLKIFLSLFKVYLNLEFFHSALYCVLYNLVLAFIKYFVGKVNLVYNLKKKFLLVKSHFKFGKLCKFLVAHTYFTNLFVNYSNIELYFQFPASIWDLI